MATGKKIKWFGAVKKVFSVGSKKRTTKRKWKLCASEQSSPPHADQDDSGVSAAAAAAEVQPDVVLPPLRQPVSTTVYEIEEVINLEPREVTINGTSVLPTALSVVHPQPPEVIGVSTLPPEEKAAIMIQTAFRAYLARRAVRAFRGLDRLKSQISGNGMKWQSSDTLGHMQALSKLQSQLRSKNTRSSPEENKEIHDVHQLGEEWDDSIQSKEQIEASILNRMEAALRREKALAYASTHQLRSSSKVASAEVNSPRRSRSSVDRSMATAAATHSGGAFEPSDKESAEVEHTANGGKKVILKPANVFTREHTRRHSVSDQLGAATQATMDSVSSSAVKPLVVGHEKGFKPASPSGASVSAVSSDDPRTSAYSDRPRRASVAGSSPLRHDKDSTNTSPVPSYMQSTQSIRAKSRLSDKGEEQGKGTSSASSTVKRSSYSGDKTTAQSRRNP